MAPPEPGITKLLLVDDHEIVRVGLRTLFARSADVKVVGEAATAREAVAAAASLKPDVVLMDVRLPDGSGAEACRKILAASNTTRVLILTSFLDEDVLLSTITAGAKGFLLKEISGNSLIAAVKATAAGQAVLEQNAVRIMVAHIQALTEAGILGGGESLSRQERRVLSLVAEGRTNKEIASTMALSPKTVKNYLSNIFQKLGVHRRSRAAIVFSQRSSR